jgi:hypothetical protein
MLRRQVENILVNTLSASTLVQIGGNCTGKVQIAGFGEIDNSMVTSCFFKCSTNGRLKVVSVTVVIPQSCECPYEWALTTVCYPNLELGSRYEVNNTFNVPRLYTYQDPAGGVPTATATAAAIASNINADKYACVTATAIGAVITLTAKDTDHQFDAYTPSGSVNIVNPGARPILSASELYKLFPIQPGQFGAQPDLTNCGTYCQYHFELTDTIQDISAASHWNDYRTEINFYVNNSNVAQYYQFWHNIMICNFPCLSVGSGISGHIS